MNAETTNEDLVIKFRGEILLNEGQVELLLKKIISSIGATRQAPPALAMAPLMFDPLKGRLMFTVKETAEMLGVTDKTVYRLVQRNLLGASRALRHIRIPRAEIERFLKR